MSTYIRNFEMAIFRSDCIFGDDLTGDGQIFSSASSATPILLELHDATSTHARFVPFPFSTTSFSFRLPTLRSETMAAFFPNTTSVACAPPPTSHSPSTITLRLHRSLPPYSPTIKTQHIININNKYVLHDSHSQEAKSARCFVVRRRRRQCR